MRALEQQSIVRLTYAGRERGREKNRVEERDATAVTYLVLRSTPYIQYSSTAVQARTYYLLATYPPHILTNTSPSAPLQLQQLQLCKRPTVTRRPEHARQVRHVGLPEREVSRV